MIPLWERLSHIYGHKWTSAFGECAFGDNGELTDVARTWLSALEDLDTRQIADGLRSCCDDPSNEWPNLPMFRARCLKRNQNEHGLNYLPLYYREKYLCDLKTLPKKPDCTGVGLSSLKDIKKLLGR